MIATCRVVLPATMVRLSAGRMGFSQGEQTLMFLAGANSIFYGEQLLTTPNPEVSRAEQCSWGNTPRHTHSADEYHQSSHCVLNLLSFLPPLLSSPPPSFFQVDKDRQLFAALGLKGKVRESTSDIITPMTEIHSYHETDAAALHSMLMPPLLPSSISPFRHPTQLRWAPTPARVCLSPTRQCA
jgi:Biotin and Thiamin Synthesis associated domain